jgi:uroporphyrinogen decarboxylase
LKERVLTALHHGIPDIVPIYDSLDDSHVMKVMNLDRSSADARVSCYKKLGFDAIPAKTKTFQSKLKRDQKGRQVVIDEWNRQYVYTEGQIKFYSNGVMTREEFSGFKWPNPDDPERYDEIARVTKLAGDDLAVIGVVSGPFEKAVLAWSFDRFLPMLLKREGIALQHLEKVRDYWIRVGKREKEIGVDAIMITDDYAFKRGPFFSPRLFQDTILPLLRDEVHAFKKLGIPVIHHSDGNTTLLLPLLAETGIDGIHSIEPTAGMDIGILKKEYGKRLTLIGNIDSGELLSFGTPDEVEHVVRDTIARAAPGGSYILSSSNSLHYACKLENIIAMLSAAKKYGKYSDFKSTKKGL